MPEVTSQPDARERTQINGCRKGIYTTLVGTVLITVGLGIGVVYESLRPGTFKQILEKLNQPKPQQVVNNNPETIYANSEKILPQADPDANETIKTMAATK
jgi:hypothetical protein